ncbi:MAG: TonB-dependent receptor [Pseudomonadota bacterium]
MATGGLCLPATSYSQDSSSGMEEVVVSARKRSENLQEVPIAVTAFTEETIKNAGIERPADYIALMPNVTIVDTANVGDTQVSIRGIVSTRDAEATFAYVVDGILQTNPNSFNEELVDVQQIEVLKGPQGALYGRNAVSGAILVTTKQPGDELEASIKLGAGNAGQQRAALRLAGPLSDSVGASLAASYRSQDGFYENIFQGGDDVVDFHEDLSLRGRLIWDVSDNLRFDFRAGHSDVEAGAINFNAGFAIPAFATVFGSDSFFADVNDLDFRFVFNTPGENEQETTDLAVKMDWQHSWGDIVANVAYNNLDEYLLSDGTSATFYGYELTPQCQTDRETLNSFATPEFFGPAFQPFGVLPPGPDTDFMGVYGPYTPTACDGFQYQERNQEDLSAEIRFVSPQDQALRWIGGLYVADIEREVVVAYGADQGQGYLRQPYVPPTGPNPTDLLFWDVFDTQVLALFGELEYDLTDTMEVALALRWDREERDVSNQVPNVTASGLNINTLDGNGMPGPINPGLASNPGGIPDRSAEFDQLQPKVTWRWGVSENVNVYASWGVGFRSGGFNSLGSSDLLNFWFNTGSGGPGELVDAQLVINDTYDKEVSTNTELGLKMELFDGRLRLNTAIFNTDVEDNQFFEFFAGPFGLLRVVTTIDEINIRGFEADFNYFMNENFSLFGGIGLLDSEIEENRNRPLSEGNSVPQAPEETFNLGAQFQTDIGGLGFTARADYQYVGDTWFHTLQGEQVPTIWQVFFPDLGPLESDFSRSKRDAYGTLNLRMTLESERWSVSAWGRNITDEEFLQEVIPAPEFGGTFNHPSALAAYGLDVAYTF